MFVGGGLTISGALFAIYKVGRRLEMAIGVDSKGRTIADRLDRVEHQLWENGGSSLADRVNKIESCSRETSTEVKFIKELIINNTSIAPISEQTSKPRQRKIS